MSTPSLRRIDAANGEIFRPFVFTIQAAGRLGRSAQGDSSKGRLETGRRDWTVSEYCLLGEGRNSGIELEVTPVDCSVSLIGRSFSSGKGKLGSS